MPSNHLVLCCPLLLLPSIFHIIRVFSSELALCIRWPRYWSFSFSISPSNEYSGIKYLRVSAQKGREGWLHVACILQVGIAQRQERNSTRTSFFCQLVRVGCVIGFQSLLGHCMRDQLWFHPTQRLAKLRCLETPRNRKEGQGRPVSATQQENPCFPVTCLLRTQQLSPLKKPKASTATTKSRFYRILSHGFVCSQMPSHLTLPHCSPATARTPNLHQQPAPASVTVQV